MTRSSSKHDNTYDRYIESDQFIYDENRSMKSFIKQDDEELNIPGNSVRVKLVDSDWKIFVNENEVLLLKGSRFTSKEREWLQTKNGFLFLLMGAKQGWNSVSEFKRQLKDKLEV